MQQYAVLVKQERQLEDELVYPTVTSVIQSRISPQYSPSFSPRSPFSPPGPRTNNLWPASCIRSKSEEEEEQEGTRFQEMYTSPQKSSLVIENENKDDSADLEPACRIESVIKVSHIMIFFCIKVH